MAFSDLLARFRQTDDEYAEEYEEEEYVDTTSSAVTKAEAEVAPRAPQMRSEKVINMHGGMGSATLVVLKPKDYNDIMKDAVRFLKENAIVILNLDNVTAEARMRIVDFMTGVIAVIDGKMERIASCTYTVTPRNVSLQGDLIEYEMD